MGHLKMYFLLKMGIFHCYVSLPGGRNRSFCSCLRLRDYLETLALLLVVLQPKFKMLFYFFWHILIHSLCREDGGSFGEGGRYFKSILTIKSFDLLSNAAEAWLCIALCRVAKCSPEIWECNNELFPESDATLTFVRPYFFQFGGVEIQLNPSN